MLLIALFLGDVAEKCQEWFAEGLILATKTQAEKQRAH